MPDRCQVGRTCCIPGGQGRGACTAWVTDPYRCSCGCTYGGSVHSPDNSETAWPLLADIWQGFALLMSKWCAMGEGEMLVGINLNLYGGTGSCIHRHSDNELMFGSELRSGRVCGLVPAAFPR